MDGKLPPERNVDLPSSETASIVAWGISLRVESRARGRNREGVVIDDPSPGILCAINIERLTRY
jgi:hypothetical protein